LVTSDPEQLHDYALYNIVGRQDGKGMMATGWTIWTLTGDIHGHQASDFLTDGYDLWVVEPGFDPSLGRLFLEDLLARMSDNPSLDGDIWSLPQAVVLPVSTY